MFQQLGYPSANGSGSGICFLLHLIVTVIQEVLQIAKTACAQNGVLMRCRLTDGWNDFVAFIVNVTNQLLMKNLNALEKEMIVYKAPKEQHVITVFTDITCGYCHKLHEQMSDYNALGITVRYLAFPRQGLQSQAEQDMKAIWCAKDRNKALDDAMNGKGVQPASCGVDIAKHYTLGVQMGVNGTPAMVLSNGMVLPGYQGPKELKAFLDEHKKQTSGN